MDNRLYGGVRHVLKLVSGEEAADMERNCFKTVARQPPAHGFEFCRIIGKPRNDQVCDLNPHTGFL